MQTDQVCIAVHKPPKESKGMAHRYLTIPDISSMDISCIPIVISKKASMHARSPVGRNWISLTKAQKIPKRIR